MADWMVEVRQTVGRSGWLFSLHWGNGNEAMTSKPYTRRETALELARQLSDRLKCRLVDKGKES